MAVILQHCLEFTPLNNPDASFANPLSYLFVNDFNLGRFGVIVFFFISGFLIPSSIGARSRPILNFAIGRFFRLYPLYWTSIAAALIALAILGREIPGPAQVMANLTMIQTLLGSANILDPYWTLLIELFFYVFCVMIFMSGSLHDLNRMNLVMWRTSGLLIGLAIFLALAPETKHTKHLAYVMYAVSYVFAMIVGHCVRLSQARELPNSPKADVLLFIMVFGLIGWARYAVGGYNDLLSPASVFFSSTAALLVFLYALHSQALTSAAVVFTGQISYGLYLFHGIALWIAVGVVGKPEDVPHSLLLIGCVMAIAFAAATLSFYLIEQPFISLGKNIRRSVREKAKTAKIGPSIADLPFVTAAPKMSHQEALAGSGGAPLSSRPFQNRIAELETEI